MTSVMHGYAELAATTNFSFLRGASHPEELVAAAMAQGLAGIGIADRNSLAGVVRAHSFEKANRSAAFRLAIGARLVFCDGAPDILSFPKDRAAYGRLTRLLTRGNSRAQKGACLLRFNDLFEAAEGQQLIVMPMSTWERRRRTAPGRSPARQRNYTRISSSWRRRSWPKTEIDRSPCDAGFASGRDLPVLAAGNSRRRRRKTCRKVRHWGRTCAPSSSTCVSPKASPSSASLLSSSDLLGLDISEGALVNILDAARASFTAATAAIRARLLGGTILQSDETGLRVGKRNWWLWVFHHDDSAIFVATPSRAKKVVADFLGDFRPEFWVSDRDGGKMGWASVNNQVCLAHLIGAWRRAAKPYPDLSGASLYDDNNVITDDVALERLREVAGGRVWLAATMTYGQTMRRDLGRRIALAARTRLPLLAVNDVLMHVAARRPLAGCADRHSRRATRSTASACVSKPMPSGISRAPPRWRGFSPMRRKRSRETLRFLDGARF